MARDILDDEDINWNLPSPDQIGEDSVVPVGNGELT